MADEPPDSGEAVPPHRGRIQAQGGGTEKSVAWTSADPPTVAEMLAMCDQLEASLSKTELKDRQKGLEKLRRFIHTASQCGGIDAPCPKSWRKPGSRDIRIDLEVISGRAAVPVSPTTTNSENTSG